MKRNFETTLNLGKMPAGLTSQVNKYIGYLLLKKYKSLYLPRILSLLAAILCDYFVNVIPDYFHNFKTQFLTWFGMLYLSELFSHSLIDSVNIFVLITVKVKNTLRKMTFFYQFH